MTLFDCFVAWADKHQGLAAWAQGVFSILAIVAAIWIARSDARERKRERRDAEKTNFEIAKRLFQQAANEIEDAHRRMKLEDDVGNYLLGGPSRRAKLLSGSFQNGMFLPVPAGRSADMVKMGTLTSDVERALAAAEHYMSESSKVRIKQVADAAAKIVKEVGP